MVQYFRHRLTATENSNNAHTHTLNLAMGLNPTIPMYRKIKNQQPELIASNCLLNTWNDSRKS